MREANRITLVVTCALTLVFVAPAVAEPGALGIWVTEEEKSHVEIYACGEQLCGRIIWLKEPLNEDGSEKLDINNENPALQGRPIVGLELMSGFVEIGERKWKKGRIYDPESGKLYKCKMELTDADTLKVRGFIGISILGRTSIWTRVAEGSVS